MDGWNCWDAGSCLELPGSKPVSHLHALVLRGPALAGWEQTGLVELQVPLVLDAELELLFCHCLCLCLMLGLNCCDVVLNFRHYQIASPGK